MPPNASNDTQSQLLEIVQLFDANPIIKLNNL